MKNVNHSIAKSSDTETSFEKALLFLREKLLTQKKHTPNYSLDNSAGENPLVSIVVLNQNGEMMLENCLNALLQQTYTNFEIIVVDNASTDGSIEIVENYLRRTHIQLIQSERNRGVGGGRNLGIRLAKGEIVAFIDNDGYAAPTWLEQVVAAFNSPKGTSLPIGAIGSLVFFSRNPLVVNGAGGTRNRQWYAGDNCYNQPLEFATLPNEVLYPMGCGMAIRRDVLKEIGEFDESANRWFDDTELGIRTWLCGYSVLLVPSAVVDHGFQSANPQNPTPKWKQAFSFEKVRIRMALKYQPAAELIEWLLLELKMLLGGSLLRQGPVLTLAWLWNIWHLSSAVKVRKKFTNRFLLPKSLIDNSTGRFPPPAPHNQNYSIQCPVAVDYGLTALNASDNFQLHYGWYPHAAWKGREAIISAEFAACFLNVANAVSELSITLAPAAANSAIETSIVIRTFGTTKSLFSFEVNQSEQEWREHPFPVELPCGLYEILFQQRSDNSSATRALALAGISTR